MQAKDIPDGAFLRAVRDGQRVAWAFWRDITPAFPGVPYKVLRAKAATLIRRKLLDGCPCGCRGDFELTYKGSALLTRLLLENPHMTTMTAAPVSVGDRDVALSNEILRTVCGSGVHGMAIPGTDDHDEMGVYLETRMQLLGLEKTSEHYVSRTKPEGVRSGPGDTDLVLYSLRKWMRLATAGNPTVLTVLFAPDDAVLVRTPLGDELRALAPRVLSMNAGRRFLGYLDGQRDRMLGTGRQNRVPNRPELIEAYGYDTKYASHALRLGLQGLEVVTTGTLSLPVAGDALQACMEVKRGEVDQDEALRRIDDVRGRLASAIQTGKSPLPDRPDMPFINDWLVQAHVKHWGM